jgi:hypothetical protein
MQLSQLENAHFASFAWSWMFSMVFRFVKVVRRLPEMAPQTPPRKLLAMAMSTEGMVTADYLSGSNTDDILRKSWNQQRTGSASSGGLKDPKIRFSRTGGGL